MTANPGLLNTLIRSHWLALTDEQRIAWTFWALPRPEMTSNDNYLGLYGYQAYYRTNAELAAIDDALILTDPPTTDTEPSPIDADPVSLPIKTKSASGKTLRPGHLLAELRRTLPADVAVIVRQYADGANGTRKRKSANSHAAVLAGGGRRYINLQAPNGTHFRSAAASRSTVITGANAVRIRSRPSANLYFVSRANGKVAIRTLRNAHVRASTNLNPTLKL